jgi:hypothetical protein
MLRGLRNNSAFYGHRNSEADTLTECPLEITGARGRALGQVGAI